MALKGQSLIAERILWDLLCLLCLQMICAQATRRGEDPKEDYLCGSGNHTWRYGAKLYAIESCRDCRDSRDSRMIYPTEILATAGACVGTTAFTRLMEDACIGRKMCPMRDSESTEQDGLQTDQLRFELYVKNRKQCPPELIRGEGFRGYITVNSSDLPLEVKGQCGQIQKVHASLKTNTNTFGGNGFSNLLCESTTG